MITPTPSKVVSLFPPITIPRFSCEGFSFKKIVFSILCCCFLTSCFVIDFAFSSEIEQDQTRLTFLRIEAFKRELRLPHLPVTGSETQGQLQKLYEENHFQEIVLAINKIPLDQRDAYLSLLHGNSLLFLGKKEVAVPVFQKAFRLADSAEIKAAAMANFALVFSMSGRWKEAALWLEKSLDLDRESDNWLGQGMALSQLGVFYFKLGNTEKGAKAHIEALEIAEIIPIPWLQARQLSHLAGLYYRDQVYYLSRDYYKKAIQIYKETDDALSEAGALTALSFVYKDLGDDDQALALQSEALVVYRQLNDSGNVSKVFLNLSLIYRDQGLFDQALQSAEKALLVQKQIGGLSRLAGIEGTIGTILEKKGLLKKAISHLIKARDYFAQTGASQEIHIVDLRIQALEDQMH